MVLQASLGTGPRPIINTDALDDDVHTLNRRYEGRLREKKAKQNVLFGSCVSAQQIHTREGIEERDSWRSMVYWPYLHMTGQDRTLETPHICG
jgi:hypothetical protein